MKYYIKNIKIYILKAKKKKNLSILLQEYKQITYKLKSKHN